VSKVLGVANLLLTSVLIAGVAFAVNEVSNATSQLTSEIEQIEDRVLLNIKKDFKTMKPDTYQELLVKSDRIFSHVMYLAEKKYDGNILHPDLVDYADRAYDSVMENMYENMFYKRIYEAGAQLAVMKPFEINSMGDYVYGDDVFTEDGVVIRDKYYMDMKGGSIYSRLKDIPAGIMLMSNDLLVYPQCEKGMRPFVIYGELYQKGGKSHGVNLMTENNGWRVSFKDVDVLSDTAMQNRLIFQTACQNIPGQQPVDTESETVTDDLAEIRQ
jgi:hypothetical protein